MLSNADDVDADDDGNDDDADNDIHGEDGGKPGETSSHQEQGGLPQIECSAGVEPPGDHEHDNHDHDHDHDHDTLWDLHNQMEI